ncbi:MAG: hypothetical protein IKE94_00475 [Aeriscardovia sp.]|nr:hypothetical protein [Aeriscardovia sp.]MBR4414015.1 hypothetical protein [Aeriscardovia sp.]
MQIKARLSGILIWIIGLFLLLLPAMFFSQSEGQIIIGRDINFVLSTAIVIILVVCSPIFERDSPRAPRVFSLLWGLGSIWSALINLFLAGSGNDQLILAAQSWGNETIVACVLLLASGFFYEMCRRPRTHTSSSMTSICMMGLMSWFTGGWIFLSDMCSLSTSHQKGMTLVLIIIVISLLMLISQSRLAKLLFQYETAMVRTVSRRSFIYFMASAVLAFTGILPVVFLMIKY